MQKINFAWPVTTLCKFDYLALKNVVETQKNNIANKKLVIMGAGIRGTAFSLILNSLGINELVFTDNNPEKIGGYINEYEIVSFDNIVHLKGKCFIIISVENGYSLCKQLDDAGFERDKDYTLVENGLYEAFVKEYVRDEQIETLIMGDCGLTDISKSDSDYRNISEMLREELGQEETRVLAVHAMNCCAYYHVLQSLIQRGKVPQKVLVMANFETFTGKQHILPRSQHAPLFQMLDEINNYENSELHEYSQVTKSRFDNFQMDYFASSKNSKKKMSAEKNNRLVLRMNYMYQLDENIEPICYLKKMVQLCHDKGIKISFFIPPANYQYAEKVIGEEWKLAYDKNVSMLESMVEAMNVQLLDLSYLLGEEEFADVTTIDETANQYGRNKVVKELVEFIKL